jgi:hydrogenase assembly chaperone HypC/HupF
MCLAFPGRVVAVDEAGALVETDGRRRRAATFLVPDLAVGDWVTVTAGTVLQRLEPAEAADLMVLIRTATGTEGSPS